MPAINQSAISGCATTIQSYRPPRWVRRRRTRPQIRRARPWRPLADHDVGVLGVRARRRPSHQEVPHRTRLSAVFVDATIVRVVPVPGGFPVRSLRPSPGTNESTPLRLSRSVPEHSVDPGTSDSSRPARRTRETWRRAPAAPRSETVALAPCALPRLLASPGTGPPPGSAPRSLVHLWIKGSSALPASNKAPLISGCPIERAPRPGQRPPGTDRRRPGRRGPALARRSHARSCAEHHLGSCVVSRPSLICDEKGEMGATPAPRSARWDLPDRGTTRRDAMVDGMRPAQYGQIVFTFSDPTPRNVGLLRKTGHARRGVD